MCALGQLCLGQALVRCTASPLPVSAVLCHSRHSGCCRTVIIAQGSLLTTLRCRLYVRCLLLYRRQVQCKLLTVSEIMREHRLTCINLLKIDVERAELDVLKGIAASDWQRIEQVSAEVHDWRGRKTEVEHLLHAHFDHVVVEQTGDLKHSTLYNVYCTRTQGHCRTAVNQPE